MEKEQKNRRFGLLGKNISYSFSRGYFSEKFDMLGLNHHEYVNFDIQSIEDFPRILANNDEYLCGMNVTIPYKEEIFSYLDKVSKKAQKIGAVNTIKITKKGNLKGYNTDEYGFRKSLEPLLKKHHKKALVLGTGGASKAVAYALKKLDISYTFVSRVASNEVVSYDQLNQEIIEDHTIIINCTPLGTFPKIDECPEIPYEYLTEQHLLYDLIYNPKETLFLQKGKQQNTTTKNGLEMLQLQAEKSWKIWNKNSVLL